MKYFWKFLIGRKKFSYVLLSFFLFSFFFKRVLSTKFQTSHQRDFEKKVKLFSKASKIHLFIRQMIVKIIIIIIIIIIKMSFDLLQRSSPLWWDKGYIPLWWIFLRILYLFDSIFSEIVWIDKLHPFHKRIYLPNKGCHRNRKKAIYQLSKQHLLWRKKTVFKTLNLIDSNHHIKNWVDWVMVGWDKIS